MAFHRTLQGTLILALASGLAHADPKQEEVFAAERAFAASMAQRDLRAFSDAVSEEAVFFSGGKKTLRGKAAVVQGWSAFFEGAKAPFSWEPDQVEVLDSGALALSTGLVRGPDGKPFARFNSIWRFEAPGRWRVIFDKGSELDAADPH